jgi:hypothetical protein
MSSGSNSALFFCLEWSTSIDAYLSQRFVYEQSKAIMLVKIANLAKKITLAKIANERLTSKEISVTKEISNTLLIFLHASCEHAMKYRISFEDTEKIKENLNISDKNFEYLAHNLPQKHIWIELNTPTFYNTQNQASGIFFYKLDSEYKLWASHHDTKTVHASAIERIQQDKGRWTLEVIDTQGIPIVSFKYYASSNQWEFTYPHTCSTGKCRYKIISSGPTAKYVELKDCQDCHHAFEYWLPWFSSTYKLLNDPKNFNDIEIDSFQAIEKIQSTKISESHKVPPIIQTSPHSQPIPELQPQKHPTVITNPLLIDRYIKHNKEVANIEQAHKYLWMHSAWIMTEALRHTADNIHLYFPEKSIYIELEQPRQLHKQQVAAFSFSESNQHVWTLSIIDSEGHIVWTVLYEKDAWTLPKKYICPEHQCITEETLAGTSYLLCQACQGRITYYTTWITTVLRMIAGDFQENIELQEPEEVLETTTNIVRDDKTGKSKEVHTLHKYRIIRYYDASKYKGKESQTKRGSWMSGRPLAESEYEINLDAVIYVQIQPRNYQRTYRHKRYKHVRGTTEHIKPGPRLQPMTIASFRQLRRIQKITRVFASKFDTQQRYN